MIRTPYHCTPYHWLLDNTMMAADPSYCLLGEQKSWWRWKWHSQSLQGQAKDKITEKKICMSSLSIIVTASVPAALKNAQA